MKKSEIEAKAQKFMTENKESRVFATADGQLFLTKNYRDLHARSKKLEVFTFVAQEAAETKKESKQDDANKALNSKETIALVNATTDNLKLLELENLENSLEKPRKTVLSAIALKRAQNAGTGAAKIDNNKQKDDK